MEPQIIKRKDNRSVFQFILLAILKTIEIIKIPIKGKRSIALSSNLDITPSIEIFNCKEISCSFI